MISDAVLGQAVGKGLITAGQAVALQSLAREAEPRPSPRDPVRDPEALRFVSGFADIFVTLGVVLFLGSAAYLVNRSASTPVTAGCAAAASWLLAEYFSRVRRMALPSIVLLLVFAGASFVALSGVLGATRGGGLPQGWLSTWVSFSGGGAGWGGAAAALLAAGLVALHFWRFRVPVSVAAGAACLVLSGLLALAAAAPAFTARFLDVLLFATGLVAFTLAMRFDLSDPARLTRRTDIAFWLHLLAAPLIVHSVFHAFGADRSNIAPLAALAVLAIFFGLGAVAVLVDRRALLVSGLLYAGVALNALVRHITGESLGVLLPVTMLALGAFVLLLSAGWYPLRRFILARLPDGLALRLPHPATPTA